MITKLFDMATDKAGNQTKLGKMLGLPQARISDFRNYEVSKRKPSDEVILTLAEILDLDKAETLYEAKRELEPEKASLWDFLKVRSAGLEPTPQASETCTLSS